MLSVKPVKLRSRTIDFNLVREDGLFLQFWNVRIAKMHPDYAIVVLEHYRTMARPATYLKWQTVKKYTERDPIGFNTLDVSQVPIPKALLRHLEEKLQRKVELFKKFS